MTATLLLRLSTCLCVSVFLSCLLFYTLINHPWLAGYSYTVPSRDACYLVLNLYTLITMACSFWTHIIRNIINYRVKSENILRNYCLISKWRSLWCWKRKEFFPYKSGDMVNKISPLNGKLLPGLCKHERLKPENYSR